MAGGGLQGVPLRTTLSGFKSFSLTSVELQMLTNSCVKLQTVHSIPLTINKEGELSSRGLTSLSAVSLSLGPWISIRKECVCCLEPAGLSQEWTEWVRSCLSLGGRHWVVEETNNLHPSF